MEVISDTASMILQACQHAQPLVESDRLHLVLFFFLMQQKLGFHALHEFHDVPPESCVE